MKHLKKILSLLISFFVIYSITSCSSKSITDSNNIEKHTVTDLEGRTVEIKNNCNSAIAIGPGALRLYCYVNGSDKITGIENIDKENESGRAYMIANSSLKQLDVIGPGGPNNAPDAEKILANNPDVIFSTYADSDKLQEKTGIPVISLSYGNTAVFDEDLYKSIELIGKVMDNESRASDVVNFIKQCKTDLQNRTCNINDNNKIKVYTGAINMKGSHGIESTEGNNPLYNAINANNVVDETGKTGSVMIDKEQLIKWNPDLIFIDYGGLNLVNDDYKANPEFYNNLKAFRNGEIYSLHPYNHYTTNIGTAISDAYYMGTIIYPDDFKDIDAKGKANEIYKFLLSKELYDNMSNDFGEFEKITLK